jgi:hypothetical protein
MILTWWGSRRPARTGHFVTVVMQDDRVVEVQVDEAPAMQIRRLSGMVDA